MVSAGIVSVLGGPRAIPRPIATTFDLVEVGGEGLTKAALISLADHLGLSMTEIAAYLPLSERTLQRYSRKKRLNRAVTERILQMAEVAARGLGVFGSREHLQTWVRLPNTTLSGRTPLSLMVSQFGAAMVLDLLGRIEHGVIS